MTLINKKIWSPNWSNRPNGIRDVYGVILHHTASPGDSAIGVAQYLARPSTEASAHFIVGDNGYTIQGVSLERAAWHAGTARYDFNHDGRISPSERYVNTHTIGIEQCNTGKLSDNYPNLQIKRVAQLILWLDRKCPNLSLRNITDHEAVNLRGKVDVGANYPAAKLFWYILHPKSTMQPPKDVYAQLPKWAQRQCAEIKR